MAMKLRVLDQINVTAVRSDTLQPREEIEVDDDFGARLLKQHPTAFEQVEDGEKAAPEHADKAKPAHADKAAPGPKRKRKAT
jgi:hypothetical protein